MKNKLHRGSCLCGSTQYELEGEFQSFFLCHCSRCQKDTGSAHASNLFAPQSKLSWRQGEENVSIYQLPNSRHAKAFCKRCGSALPLFAKELGFTMVPAGSLDTPVPISPTAKIFMASCADWLQNINHDISFDEFPE
ncbi:GFA family protein [Vibrio sp. S4M6]|uniref:GFA family protein n=1 Tax=Vibrio sinus TaxID=2946865 RepID=UPI00202A7209|nr:GFA family protein [Vibrio sinus]MCL9782445.1 GFA family protein [Vibrio sinus]